MMVVGGYIHGSTQFTVHIAALSSKEMNQGFLHKTSHVTVPSTMQVPQQTCMDESPPVHSIFALCCQRQEMEPLSFCYVFRR